MPAVFAHVVEVTDANALLRVGCAGIGALFHTRQRVFELRHTCNRKQDRLVTHGYRRAARYKCVLFLFEKLDEFVADLAAFHELSDCVCLF